MAASTQRVLEGRPPPAQSSAGRALFLWFHATAASREPVRVVAAPRGEGEGRLGLSAVHPAAGWSLVG